MPDDKDNYNLPQDGQDNDEQMTDNDIPFRLPKAENAGTFRGDIHKDETADFDPVAADDDDDDPYEQATMPQAAEDVIDATFEEDVDALRAADPPLAAGPPEDNSMVMRAGLRGDENDDDDDLNPTVPQDGHDDQYTADMDVPFKLPKHDGDSDDGPIANRFVTMPHDPSAKGPDPNAAHTLAGSGGLDPNPDFVNTDRTMPNLTVQAPQRRESPPTIAGGGGSYQRPVNQQAGFAPPMQRDTPPPQPGRGQPGVPAGRPLPARGKRRSGGRRRRLHPGCMVLIVMFLTFCGGLMTVLTIGGAFAYARVGDLLNERLDAIESYQALQSNTILDRNGQELYTVFSEQGMRINIGIESLPRHVIDATLAIEDDSFYSHIGIDIGATSVALFRFMGASSATSAGGSTITQQLVRNVLFDPEYRAERSARRKAEEIGLAIALEARKSKDDILELYLNEIYYGNLAYGIEAAAQVIFDKSARDLTIGEAALLAGLPNIPAFFDPLSDDPEVQQAVEDRRLRVLEEMVTDGFITQAQYQAAMAEPMNFSEGGIDLSAPHFTVYAIEELDTLLTGLGYTEEQIARGGLNVMTTVDLGINNMAQETAAQRISEIRDSNNAGNAAVIVMNPGTGEILGMVGSIDYYNDAIDGNVNVTTRPRQPGSTMKSFTYAAAMERELSPGDVIWDTPVRVQIPGQPDYVPRNYDGGFHGPMRVRTALANSYNIPAIQAMRYIGVDYLLELMSRFGVESLGTDSSRYGISLTLGGGEITLLELVRGYSVFANEGQLVQSTAVLCIWDNDDNIIYEYNNSCPGDKRETQSTVQRDIQREQVLDPRIAFIISDILADNNARSTEMGGNSALFTPGIASSAKTGTTNDIKDNWTVGFTRNVAVGVWIGNNNGDPMTNNLSGLRSAAPIWNRVLTTIYDTSLYLNEFANNGQLRSDQRQAPNGLTFTNICNINSLSDPATNCPGTVTEYLFDSPAGQYDGGGQIIFPPANSNQNPPQVGSYVQEIQPGIYRAAVYPLNPAIAASIQFNLGPGETPPPAPIYCRMPVEQVSITPGVQELIFLPPPQFQADAVAAENYARQRGIPFLPTVECNDTMLNGGAFGGNFLTAFITSPSAGQGIPVDTPIAIIGTAQFNAAQAEYYRIDIRGGQWPDWTTIGPIHEQPVANGQLDTLPGLPPGEYAIRLIIVGLDGNFAQPGFEVPFTVQ